MLNFSVQDTTELKLACRRLQEQEQHRVTHCIPVQSVAVILLLWRTFWGQMELSFVLRVELSPVRTRGCTDLGHLSLGVSEVSKSRHWHGNKKPVEENLKGKQWWGQKSQHADVFFPYPLRRTVLLLIQYMGCWPQCSLPSQMATLLLDKPRSL